MYRSAGEKNERVEREGGGGKGERERRNEERN